MAKRSINIWSILLRKVATTAFIVTIISCTDRPREDAGLFNVDDPGFKVPVITRWEPAPNPIKFADFVRPVADADPVQWRNDEIRQILPTVSGKSAFCDTLNWDQMEFDGLDKYNNSLPSLDDDGMILSDTVDAGDYESNDRLYNEPEDSPRVNGFELIPDYRSTFLSAPLDRLHYWEHDGNLYYPVYLVNPTRLPKLFIGKDRHLFAIQEAQDKNGDWRPIEARGMDSCGNGYWGLTIHPKEFVAFLMPKYGGDFKTKLRVRVRVGLKIYVSAPFEAEINESQMHFNSSQLQFFKRNSDDFRYPYLDFYGAKPLEN